MAVSNYIPSSRVLQPGVCTSSTRPAAPYNGQVIYETDTGKTLVWNGSAWVMLTNSTTPPGLELIKTQTVGSAVASVSVTNAFSSTYDNYRIVISGITPSATDSFRVMMGTGATTNHFGSMYYDLYTGGGTSTLRVNNAGSFYVALNEGSTLSSSVTFDVMTPNIAQYTQAFGNYSGRGYVGWFGALINTSTQYTGFTLLTDGAGTMTGGTIRVYGYRNTI